MYSAANNLIQSQVVAPLAYLVSQSSASALVSSRPALAATTARQHSTNQRRPPSHNEGAAASAAKSAEATIWPSSIPDIPEQSQHILPSINSGPNILSIINAKSSDSLRKQEVFSSAILNSNASVKSLPSNNGCSNLVKPAAIDASSTAAASDVTSVVHQFLSKASAEQLLTLSGSQLLDSKAYFNRLRQMIPTRSINNIVQDVLNEVHCLSNRSSKSSIWRESHVSTSSFQGNKIIDEQRSVNSTEGQDRSTDSRLAPLLSSMRGLLLSTQAQAGVPTRGFKTVRSIEQEAARHVSVRDRLLGSKPAPAAAAPATTAQTAAASSSRLKTLLSEQGSESSQQQLKVAFAEGYLASDGAANEKPSSRTKHRLQIFQNMLGIALLLAVLTMVMSAMSGSLFRFKLKTGSEVQPEEITVSFDDVKGVEEAKQELEEIVEFLKSPEKFTSLGAELPKGALLVGPPGTGKTLLARAVAGEAGVPFFHAAGPEFDEMLVGQGARRVRDLFSAAKARAPCVIFIDEIDSVGAKRSNSVLHPYANQTINQLLSEMDGFHKNEGVIVLGATNRRDDLDKALLRPGRFDVEVQVPIPDLAGRREIFHYYLGKVKVGQDVETEVLSRGTTGFTGADIKNVVNQAALRAAADLVDAVSMKHLEAARDKVLMGPEKKSRIPDEEVNLVTAYHEGGHTLVAHYTEHCHPLHKVTIIPRGPSLGHTAYIPAKEQYNVTRAQMQATLDSLMGGRAAEELVFGTEMITSGASSDLKQATSVAMRMVKDFGMSDRVGLRTFEDTSGQLLGGGESLSTSTKEAIDAEIKRILAESYDRARTILRTHAKEHKALAEALLKYETLDADDVKAILDGRGVNKDV